MKIRMLALAGVAAVAFSAPAFAATEGWYLGLAGGYDQMPSVKVKSAPFPSTFSRVGNSDSGIGMASFGYSWASGFRLENEISYTEHDAKNGFGGSSSVAATMFNLVYDIPLSDVWKLSIGGGVGAGNARAHWTNGVNNSLDLVKGSHVSLEYQAIAGIAYSLSPDVDLFADYRYRANQNDATYNTSYSALAPMKVGSLTENAVVVGLRWFMTPPPPPPPPPPPAKTYIVFFDFDKSDLTAEAQSTVTQAVAAAKTLGSVRIMVTGHTDTMGSDKYNQALSVRRATTVKEEMVRQGLGADSVAIEGKSFHDPMVPTGPNVREPKNRRAVIDLGG